jgi:hypothetical protein
MARVPWATLHFLFGETINKTSRRNAPNIGSFLFMCGNARVIIKPLPHLPLVLNHPLNTKSLSNSDLCRFVAFSFHQPRSFVSCVLTTKLTSLCRDLLFFRNTSLSGIGSWRAWEGSPKVFNCTSSSSYIRFPSPTSLVLDTLATPLCTFFRHHISLHQQSL